MPYGFGYDVRDEYTGANFGHREASDGYVTEGEYYVPLPDGRLQKVSYYVSGDSGFVAQVSYEGKASYPAYYPAEEPPPPDYFYPREPHHLPSPADPHTLPSPERPYHPPPPPLSYL